MSQAIEIESIKRLDVKSGETLVVTLPTGLDSLQLQGYRDQISERLPEGVQILLVSGEVKFEVVAKVDEPPTCEHPSTIGDGESGYAWCERCGAAVKDEP